jgi:DNA-binding MarR family transcriptional regulator
VTVDVDVSVEAEFLSTPGHDKLFARLVRVSLLLEEFQQSCFSEFSLRFIDYSLLRVLHIGGPPYEMAPTKLSKVLVRSTGGMTQILDRLEREGHVRRTPSPDDRRKVIVGLTPQGLRLVKRANARYEARKAALLGQVDDAELDRIDETVRQLMHLFDGSLAVQASPVT